MRGGSLLLALLLSGCSPSKNARSVVEPMIWSAVADRSLIELRFVHDPRRLVRICSTGLLERLERSGSDRVDVEFRVWSAWPWSRRMYGFNPEKVAGLKIQSCDHPGQIAGSEDTGTDPHPLDRHL
jgi:hypothetical protein